MTDIKSMKIDFFYFSAFSAPANSVSRVRMIGHYGRRLIDSSTHCVRMSLCAASAAVQPLPFILLHSAVTDKPGCRLYN